MMGFYRLAFVLPVILGLAFIANKSVHLLRNFAVAADSEPTAVAAPSLLADRLSIILRGVPASQQERDAINLGQTDLNKLSETYKNDPRFAERLAHYWLEVLKVKGPFDFSMVENIDETSLLTQLQPVIRRAPTALINRQPPACDQPRLELFMAGQATQEEVQRKEDQCAALPAGEKKTTCENQLTALRADLERTNTFRAEHDCNCNNNQLSSVNPWWNPSEQVRVCTSVVTPEICGSRLQNCMPMDSRIVNRRIDAFLQPVLHDGNRFFDEVITGLTLEPGMLIAKLVQEDLDFRTALTTTQTVLPGAVETFLNSRYGSMILDQAAGDWSVSLVADQSTRKTWRWVERGQGNAGVLTTPQFHQVTNGYRAKANRTYETFLCRQFVIPPGVIDTNPDETDLTKRQPCASCHIELEPLGNMFKRWPELGTNFLYNRGLDASGGFTPQPTGKFEVGVDVPDLGKLIVKDVRFAECTVQRAFEFLVGESPDDYDIEHHFPQWIKTLESNGYKVWPVMQEIIRSVHFQGGWK